MDDTDRERLYRAFCARDSRFDGKYFIDQLYKVKPILK